MAPSSKLILALSLCSAASLIPAVTSALEPTSYNVIIKVKTTESGNLSLCSGAIIDQKWVLTAARCVSHGLPTSPSDYKVYLDSNNTHPLDVKNVFTDPEHNAYVNFGYNHNFALVQMKEKFDPTKTEVISIGKSFTGEANATGYHLRSGRKHHLSHVKVNIMSKDECSRVHSYRPDDTIFCGGNRDNCQLDFGSPLVQDGDLVGIFIGSHDHNCERNPGVYGRVVAVKAWINEKIRS